MASHMIVKSFIFMSLLSMASTEPYGFTTDLIHRDSPQSPTFDPSLSPAQRQANAILRSSYRTQRFNTKLTARGAPISDIVNSHGEYLMRYSIGSPPVPSLAIADTGSDIIWTQCQPCIKCFNQTLTLFNPKKSSTYRTIHCETPDCASFSDTACSPTRKNCLYEEIYGDKSFTNGLLAKETLTLPSTNGGGVPIPNTTFGCGFKNGGIFDGGESGIVGLGRGRTSLIRQMGPLVQGRFSYCLVSESAGSKSSKLHFGSKAVVSGKDVVSTPMLHGNLDTFYYLTLEGISVGNTSLDYLEPGVGKAEAAGGVTGNVIIDSGTTLTLVPFCLYGRFEKEVSSAIKLKRVKDPLGSLTLCYRTERDDIEHPPITFHFTGADVKLKTENIFVRTSKTSLCLAAQAVLFGPGIIGNLAQKNFLVGYDLQKSTVSFKPTNCLTD